MDITRRLNKICPSVMKIKNQIRTLQIFRYDVSKTSFGVLSLEVAQQSFVTVTAHFLL